MFLMKLSEQAKTDFVELCHYAANADGVFADEERQLISRLCGEMNVAESNTSLRPLDDLLESVSKNATMPEKKIMVFELLGIVYADNEYTTEEEKFLEKVVNAIEIDLNEMRHIVGLFEIYKTIYKELYITITM